MLEHLRTAENLAKNKYQMNKRIQKLEVETTNLYIARWIRFSRYKRDGMRVRASVGSRGGHELEQLEWLHKRRASTWDWEEEVTDLLTQVYFWYVPLLGPLTCLLYLPKPSMQTECASLPWEHRTVWGQCDFQCNRSCFHSTGRAELCLVTSSTFSGATWVTQTMWSHLSLWSFYLSDQGIIHCLSQEEWWSLIHYPSLKGFNFP